MWNIIKAEIRYYRNIYLALYGFVTIFLIVNVFAGDLEDHMLWISFVTLPMIGNFVSNEEKKTRRIRLYARLPVPLRHVSIARYPVLVNYWFSLVLLICLSSYISKPFGTIALSYWEILSFAATGPLLAAGMNAHLDLKFNGIRPGKKLTFRFLLAFLSVVIIVFYFTAYLTKTSRFFDLPPFLIFRHLSTALTLCCFTIGLFILSMLVFEHRKSYLE
jgi:hypothetical protein